jgi:hypothetical protein
MGLFRPNKVKGLGVKKKDRAREGEDEEEAHIFVTCRLKHSMAGGDVKFIVSKSFKHSNWAKKTSPVKQQARNASPNAAAVPTRRASAGANPANMGAKSRKCVCVTRCSRINSSSSATNGKFHTFLPQRTPSYSTYAVAASRGTQSQTSQQRQCVTYIRCRAYLHLPSAAWSPSRRVM